VRFGTSQRKNDTDRTCISQAQWIAKIAAIQTSDTCIISLVICICPSPFRSTCAISLDSDTFFHAHRARSFSSSEILFVARARSFSSATRSASPELRWIRASQLRFFFLYIGIFVESITTEFVFVLSWIERGKWKGR
jgi:hypothetical protein